jgi:hypothetical protein
MGTTLTGTKPKDTYDSLIKVTDNGPISGTAKYLSDGLGNDLPIAVSTTNVGIGTSAPATILEVSQATPVVRLQASAANAFHGIEYRQSTGVDVELKQLPATGEFRISSGRSAAWGGFTSFYIDTVERFRMTANGLTFNGDSAAANALDDYEEGTFTFTVVPDGSGSITLTNDQRTGRYTKIGQQVSIQASLIVSSVSTPVGSNVLIQGLPFAIANLYSAACGATVTFSDASLSYARTALPAIALQNQTQIIATIIASTIGASDEFHLNITYTV